ncbi:hypothetical protein Taro_017383 [Colocasia esculenta]|uniref:Ubiquitin-like protease family profile domain-containing protein n=1 Tax=Colocasia esculenta TaxID=4460 RepID=A0A843UMY9_COLES|nr:hypothetical protein [Colocasia esculenta]
MFHDTVEGYDNFLSFHDIRELLFTRESESVVIDCYVNAYLFLPREENPDLFWNFGYVGAALKGYVESCRDDKSKEQHFEYAFGKLDRAPNEFDLIFSPMHVGTNHWDLLVIHNKEKEFHVYDSLRNKHHPDIPQYVEELKSYLKGKHIDADKWPLRYPDPCPQQGSGDDCGIFTYKYMECLARRDIQDLPFSQDDMPYAKADRKKEEEQEEARKREDERKKKEQEQADGYDNWMSFNDIRELLFVRETESVLGLYVFGKGRAGGAGGDGGTGEAGALPSLWGARLDEDICE